MKKHIILFFMLVTLAGNGFSQKGITTFGIQYKPIVPNRFIGTYEQDFNEGPLLSSTRQKFGNVFGMVVRHGFTKNFSVETGINFTQRNFDLFYEMPDSGWSGSNDVRMISYSIPVSGLIYIRLGEQFYMNTSLGASMVLFPSDVQVFTNIEGVSSYFLMEGAYRGKLQGAMDANLGFEYRTKKFGYFYLGASYHLPFAPIATFAMSYEHEGGDVLSIGNIRGSYATIDLRYFFNERKDKKMGDREKDN
ncbi:MAG: hypothetical protein MI810_19365 [Flavobacteriales bacterium]|jgi:hypothetical protein|nr:hypothetical protein [Flavobacteriales bacterium]